MAVEQKRLLVLCKKWLPVLVIIGALIVFFSLGLQKYLTFQNLKAHQAALLQWTNANYFQAFAAFSVIYILAVAISVPGAVFLTLACGFLFGPIWGSFLVVISATVGASILFFAVSTAFGEQLTKRASGWVNKMRAGFNENAFNYLLVLRLVPLFPFWVVNIVPAILGVDIKVFTLATLLGIIPGSVVYVLVGSGLSHVFASNQTPNLGIIFDPKILIPLVALAFLSLLPMLYQYIKKKRKG